MTQSTIYNEWIFMTWLTRSEAAEHFKVCPSTITHIVNEMERKGIHAATGSRRGRRYCMEAISNYLLDGRHKCQKSNGGLIM